MENPSRAEAFPVGLRVLVVDDDPTWLKIIERMLKKCSYEVTTCCLATVALNLFREGREKFDIVISDVNMPDMDGFKLLEHVGLEMDLPVIMMSVDGETSRVMKGVQHGACDYLLKPIRMKELRNIWQHVYRKKIHEVREIEGHDFSEDIQMFRSGSEDFDDRQVSGGAVRKRKELDGKEPSDQERNDPSAVKKARLVWSVDLHQKFVNAVNQIGFYKAGPKKILDLMNVPGLTRENVASHLQKYRLYLSRLQKQNEGKSYRGNTQSDVTPKGPRANFGLQNPTPVNHNNATSRYVPSTQNFQAHNRTPEVYVNDVKSTVALHVKAQKEVVGRDIPTTEKLNSALPEGMMPNLDCKPVEPSKSKHQPWSAGIPVTHFMQRPKHDHERYALLGDYSHLPLTSQLCQIATNQLQTPIISISCSPEDSIGLTQIKPVFSNFRSHNNKATIDSLPVHVNHGIVNSQDLEAKHETSGSANWVPPRELRMKNEMGLFSRPENVPLCSLQNVGCFENVGPNGMEDFQYNDSMSPTDFHSNWCDVSEFNCEYFCDPVEYPIIDDCLFA